MTRTKKTEKSIELEVSNYISSFMKEKVGKGPRDVKVKIVDNTLIFFIIGSLTQLEKNILKSPEGEKIIVEGRKLYLKETNSERIPAFEKIVGSKVIDHFESWSLKMDTAIGVVVFEDNII